MSFSLLLYLQVANISKGLDKNYQYYRYFKIVVRDNSQWKKNNKKSNLHEGLQNFMCCQFSIRHYEQYDSCGLKVLSRVSFRPSCVQSKDAYLSSWIIFLSCKLWKLDLMRCFLLRLALLAKEKLSILIHFPFPTWLFIAVRFSIFAGYHVQH